MTFEEAVLLPFDEFEEWHKRELFAKRASAGTAPAGSRQLDRGDRVVWTKTVPGVDHERVASGVSQVHRVLVDGQTYCWQRIPHVERQLPVLDGMKACLRCEMLHAADATPEEIHNKMVEKAMAS